MSCAKRTGPRRPASQACDSCRRRKVRCKPLEPATSDLHLHAESHAVDILPTYGSLRCKACGLAGKTCTFDVPVKRRGPPPKRPGAVNRRSLSSILTWDSRDHDQEGHNDLGISQSSPYSNEGNAIAEDTVSDNGQIPDFASSYLHQPRVVQTPQSPARISSMGVADYQPLLSTDCICSRQSFDSIMRDYLQLIYPLVPVVHLPTFLKDLENHREQSDPTFLVFLAAICVIVVANIPKRFHEYRIMDEFFPFQSRLEMINFCYQLALQHRKVDYLDHSSHMKWATSYMLSIGYHSIRLTNRGNILFMECNHHLRMLGCLRASSFESLSCIETQLRKKALLLSLTADLHFRVRGWDHIFDGHQLSFAQADIEKLMPLEVDDEFIFDDLVLPQPKGQAAITAGINALAHIYYLTYPIICRSSEDLAKRMKDLKACQQTLKYGVDGLCVELSPWTAAPDEVTQSGGPQSPRRGGTIAIRQFDIMRANIHVSHLWLQTLTLDKIEISLSSLEMADTTPYARSREEKEESWNVREELCRQLLHILHNISQVNLQPNGASLLHKIREVAATMFDCPFEKESCVARRANAYVETFANLLSKLDDSVNEVFEP